MSTKRRLTEASIKLREGVAALSFSTKLHTVYNPLEYAWGPYKQYIETYGGPPKKAVFFGMNPGPWGMAQTGIPFGEIDAVREWLGIGGAVGKPSVEHPKRPVDGFTCHRREVSGKRVWGLMRQRFGTPEKFFRDYFIDNYCPLLFFKADGKNITPDKLLQEDRLRLYEVCDVHVREVVEILQPQFVVGFGRFVASRLDEVVYGAKGGTGPATGGGDMPSVVRLLHPSPANPRANRGWAQEAVRELESAGVW